MNLGAKLAAVALIASLPLFADTKSVAGYVTASWSGISALDPTQSGNGTNVWTYDNSGNPDSTLTFAPNYTIGSTFSGNTPIAKLLLGQLIDSNSSNSNLTKSPTASLTVNVVFTTPSGTVPLTFALGVNEQVSGNSGHDSVVSLLNANGSNNIVVNGERYTVTLDGFFTDSTGSGSAIDSITTNPGTVNSAFLFADITSAAANPEPVSIVLLGTVAVLVGIAFRKRAKSVA